MSGLFADEAAPDFRAAFPGEDMCCGQGIEPGEMIRADGYGGYVHSECAESDMPAPLTGPTRQPACPRCFCVHNGEC